MIKIISLIFFIVIIILFNDNNILYVYSLPLPVESNKLTKINEIKSESSSGSSGNTGLMGATNFRGSSGISPAIDGSILNPIGGGGSVSGSSTSNNIFPNNNQKTSSGLFNNGIESLQQLTSGGLINNNNNNNNNQQDSSQQLQPQQPNLLNSMDTTTNPFILPINPNPSSDGSGINSNSNNGGIITSTSTPPQNTLLGRIPKTTQYNKRIPRISGHALRNSNINTISEDGQEEDDEYNTFPTQISVCVGSICPNGECMGDSPSCIGQLNNIINRCPYDTPVRCPDGSCSQSLGLCGKSFLNCTYGICPNGACAPCEDYDGCPIDIPFQCPTGVCKKHVSDCTQCSNGHMKCFDGSCQSPCPFPPFYYKPISISRNIIDGTKDTKVTVNSYEQPLDYNSNHIKILDIYIDSHTLPTKTLLRVQSVADSSVEFIKGEKSWPVNLNYQLALLSPIINITATINGTTNLKWFSKSIRFEFNLINNPSFDINKMSFAFINETSGQWEIVSNVTIDNNMIVGYTNHFTSFAILTSYNDINVGVSGNYKSINTGTNDNGENSPFSLKKTNLPTILGIVFGCVGACLLIILIGVCWHHSSKHGGLRHWLISRGSKPSSSPSSSSPKITESAELMLNNSISSSSLSSTIISTNTSLNNSIEDNNSKNINNSINNNNDDIEKNEKEIDNNNNSDENNDLNSSATSSNLSIDQQNSFSVKLDNQQ